MHTYLLIIIFMCLSISLRNIGRIMCILDSSSIRGSVGIGLTRFSTLVLKLFICIIFYITLKLQSGIFRIIKHLQFSPPFLHQPLHLFYSSSTLTKTRRSGLYLLVLDYFAISSLPAIHLII